MAEKLSEESSRKNESNEWERRIFVYFHNGISTKFIVLKAEAFFK
jgi:hypothetical protein